MTDYLKIPAWHPTDFWTPYQVERLLLPPASEMNEWQLLQRKYMLEQFAAWQKYDWSAGHSGCIWDHRFRGKAFLKGGPPGVYCCGITLEHFFMCWQEWLGPEFEGDKDLTTPEMNELKAYFFLFNDPPRQRYVNGAPAGLWQLSKKKGVHYPADLGLDFMQPHTDPYKAKYGDYIQMQFKSDPLAPGGGHAAIFVGLEQTDTCDRVRVFHANSIADYGMRTGVSFAWYKIGKVVDGYERVFRFGRVYPQGSNKPTWDGDSLLRQVEA